MGVMQKREIERYKKGGKTKQRKSQYQSDGPFNFIEGKMKTQRGEMIWPKFCC